MKSIINIFCVMIPFPSMRRSLRKKLKQRLLESKNNTSRFIRKIGRKPIVLWIDHSLGGGTETYTRNQFAKLTKNNCVVRMQYWPWARLYSLTLGMNTKTTVYIKTLPEVYACCRRLKISELVVNNIVGYENTLWILGFVRGLKNDLANNLKVSFRGHDFQCLCPCFALIDCDGNFCDFTYPRGCEYCWEHKKLSEDPRADEILRSGAGKVCDWRKQWGNFFSDVVDEVIVFSQTIKNMFIRVYPQIINKILVVPHETKSYPHVDVPLHDGINIAVLGNIAHSKGRGVVIEMSKHLSTYNNVKIIVIGTMANPPDNILVTGAYNPDDLPNLMRKYQVDLVFISSIWPETFSYTTSEAISMGLPVACYDMGAPAERVGAYNRGLVLKNISPSENLMEIVNFIKKIQGE